MSHPPSERGDEGEGGGGSSTSDDADDDPLYPRGPAPGVRWRGGAPPAAPTFSGDRRADPRCWEHWRDAVAAWKFRVKHNLPLAEAALQLRDAEIISDPPMTWATQGGIERLVEVMRSPFGEEEIFHTGDLLAACERIKRSHGEKLHAYCTRYVRVERALMQVKINIAESLDAQARRRATTASEAAGRSLAAALGGSNHLPSAPRPPPPRHAVNATEAAIEEGQLGEEAAEHEDEVDGQPDDDEPNTEEAADQEPAEFDEVHEAMTALNDVLSITSQKLKGITQGADQIEQRKKTEACLDCGELGHWAGDAACKKPGANSARVTSSSTMCAWAMSQSVFKGLAVGDSIEYIDEFDSKSWTIADTACQRMVHGSAWGGTHAQRLEDRSLPLVKWAVQERFKFGEGPEIHSVLRWGCPIGIAGVALWARSSEVSSAIPQLASNEFMVLLGASINMFVGTISFLGIGVYDLPLQRARNGQLIVCISDFPNELPDFSDWDTLGEDVTLPPDAKIKCEHRRERHLERVQLNQGTSASESTKMDVRRRQRRVHFDIADDGLTEYEIPEGTIEIERQAFRASLMTGPGFRNAFLKATPLLAAFVKGCAGGLKAHEAYLDMKAPKRREPCDHQDSTTGVSTIKEYCAGRHGRYARCQQPACQMSSAERIIFETLSPSAVLHGAPLQGALKRRIGDLNRTISALEVEAKVRDVVDSAARQVNAEAPRRARILEGFAGQGDIAKRAHLFGLAALQPVDLIYGFDLGTVAGRRRWNHAIKTCKPLVVIMGFPCTKWCWYNYAINYRDFPDLLASFQDEDRPLLKLVVWTALEQQKNGRHFLLENADRSQAWEQPEFDPLWKGLNGELMRKTRTWVSNHPKLLESVTRRCDRSQSHAEVQGRDTSRSQEFTEELADSILTVVQQMLAVRSPASLAWTSSDDQCRYEWHPQDSTPADYHDQLYTAWFVDVDRDTDEWQVVLTQTMLMMEDRARYTWELPPGHEIYQRIQDLVPWELVRVQAARVPKARRHAVDIVYRHRGMTATAHAGSIIVETEALKDVQCPKLRFSEPIALAIFFFGNAPESASADGELPSEVPQPGPAAAQVHPESAAEPPVEEPGARPPAPPAQAADPDLYSIAGCRIKFPNLSDDKCPREIKAMVARLHCHHGHAGREDIRRFCAWQGAKPSVYLAIDFLKCEACERTRPPARPKPISATIRYLGQFGEHLQADFFTIVDVTNTPHHMLGIMCLNAHLHRVKRVVDRSPDTAVSAFLEAWALPLGMPMAITVDMDGSFMGYFKERLESYGVNVSYCPPDAHWQIGTVERHNASWRWIWNRTCDACAVKTAEEVDLTTIAVSEAKNNAVRRAGRSANQCALGRTPRIPGELLSDDHGFAVAANATNSQHVMNNDFYRMEANIHTAHFNYEQHVRKSLLRKTSHLRYDLDKLVAGQQVGCWRQGAKKRPSGKSSRPGFVIGTFLQWGGGQQGHGLGRNARVRVGQTIMLFSREQLVPAIGFEQWVPDAQDIEVLKSSYDLMKDDLGVDERDAGPAPDDLAEEADIFVDDGRNLLPSREGLLPPQPADADLPGAQPVPVEPPPAAAAPPQPEAIPSEPTPVETEVPRTTPMDAEVTQATDSVSAEPNTIETDLKADPPDEKRPRVSTLCAQAWLTSFWATEVGDSADGSDEVPAAFGNVSRYADYADEIEIIYQVNAIVADDGPMPPLVPDSEDDEPADQNQPTMTRAERKAYDREIPWREIMSMDGSTIQSFLQATRKEYSNWVKWAPMVAVPDDVAKDMLNSPETRKSCIRARCCYRDKNCGQGELAAKCRGIAVGCSDPRLEALERRSPTTQRISFFAACQVLASMKIYDPEGNWTACVGDLENSFFRGSREREDKVYLIPPRDPRVIATGSWLDTLYEFDKGRLLAIVLWYVDDMFAACAKSRFDFSQLEKVLLWGKLVYLPQELAWCGREINQYHDGRVVITQKEYVKGLEISDLKAMYKTKEHLKNTP
ncbi:unnamed protein product [Prorocentrum cordatum]|uniref:Integrase catalytic domain-containing protein n=1 Tax=Prorocentrum cordatum TaxID=2364126 RepID=A0ABN9S5Q6_9DINO|nr:unnamed protein product [Polarella glacialis]